MKHLVEKRNDSLARIEEIITLAEAEVRALTDEELTEIEALKAEVEGINKQEEVVEATRNLKPVQEEKIQEEEKEVQIMERSLEVRGFENKLRGLDMTSGAELIPVSVADQIVEAVVNECPMLDKATVYNVVGDLKVAVQSDVITCGFATDMEEVLDTNVPMKAKTLKSNAVVCLTKISKQLIVDTNVDVVGQVVKMIARDLATFLNNTMVVGATGKVEGLVETTNTITGEVSLDSMVALQMAVPVEKHNGAMFILAPSAFATIRQEAIAKGVLSYAGLAGNEGMKLFGREVYLCDALEEKATKAIFANLEGYAIKMPRAIEVEILRERFSTQGAIGILGTAYVDGAIINEKLVAGLVAGGVLKAKK